MTRPTASLPDRGRPGSRRARLLRFSTLVLVSVSVSACATKRDVRDLGAEIRELSAQNQALIRALQEAQDDQADSLSELARNVQENRGEMIRRMNGIEDQLLTVQELTGLGQQQLSQLRDEMERNRQAGSFGGGFGGRLPADAGAGGSTPEGLLETGTSQFGRESYSAARLAFEELVDSFPLDPAAGEARYYLAEIAYEEGDIDGAIEAAAQMVEFFPDAYSAPIALYRAARWSIEIGETDQARDYLGRVVETWPNTAAAALAEEDLDNL